MNLDKLVTIYREKGYTLLDARASVCQDIILSLISKSSFKNHVTIKGGVVMYNISKSLRRATQDMDFDFIRYSLENDAIIAFINKLSDSSNDINVIIDGDIVRLHHQDYDGKRVYIKLFDKFNNSIDGKLDIGVHKNFNIEQEEYYFSLNSIKGSVTLLINSCEEIFVEKLKSLLKFGIRSTRYKDLFDFYYLINNKKLDNKKLLKIMNILIFEDKEMIENNINDVEVRLERIFKSKNFRKNLNNPKVNWLDVSIDVALECILNFFKKIEKDYQFV